jgi:hypothetical protein
VASYFPGSSRHNSRLNPFSRTGTDPIVNDGRGASLTNDLRIPPNNRLEALAGDRAGSYRIKFSQGNAFDVEIVDYH